MSCLKIYAPDDFELAEETEYSAEFENTAATYDEAGRDDAEPEILSLHSIVDRFRNLSVMEVLARTRVMYQNKRCRCCHRPTVEPVEQDDALLNRNRMPIPGSATLVGFHCQYCRHQWRL